MVAAVLIVPAVLALMVTAFAWPSVRSAPAEVPLVVAPAQAAAQVQERLDAARPGAFRVSPVEDALAAREALRDREAYGAVVLGAAGPSVLTASAAAPVVAQLVGQVAEALAGDPAQAPVGPPVEDVVPLPASDPRGAGLVAASLPLALGGVLTAAVIGRLVVGTGRRLAAAALVALTAGATVAAVLQGWLGALGGDPVAVGGVLALAIAAGSSLVLGLSALLGTAGTGLGAALLVLLGNPLSGAGSAPEMLPDGWGAFGQLLPPGAAVSALRSVSFFDGAALGGPLVVLSGWLLLGLLLCAAATLRRRHRANEVVEAPMPVPVGA